MTNSSDSQDQDIQRRIEALVQQISDLADPAARRAAEQIVQALLDLHGMALDEMMQSLPDDDQGRSILDKWAKNETIGNVLLLHDAHPWSLEQRIEHTLEKKLRPALRYRDGDIELIEADEQRVRIRVTQGETGGCGSSGEALGQMIEDAVRDQGPDVEVIEIEGLEASESTEPGFVMLTVDHEPTPTLRHGAAAGAASTNGITSSTR